MIKPESAEPKERTRAVIGKQLQRISKRIDKYQGK